MAESIDQAERIKKLEAVAFAADDFLAFWDMGLLKSRDAGYLLRCLREAGFDPDDLSEEAGQRLGRHAAMCEQLVSLKASVRNYLVLYDDPRSQWAECMAAYDQLYSAVGMVNPSEEVT